MTICIICMSLSLLLLRRENGKTLLAPGLGGRDEVGGVGRLSLVRPLYLLCTSNLITMPPKKAIEKENTQANAVAVYEFTHYQLRKDDDDVMLDKDDIIAILNNR